MLLKGQAHEVEEVVPGGNAEQAGLRAKDKIVAINGTPLSEENDFNKLTAKRSEGKEYTFTIEREGQRLDVKVKLQASTLLRPTMVELADATAEQIATRRAVLSATKAAAAASAGSSH
jgi:predicted metalloprotease with PDZ domain